MIKFSYGLQSNYDNLISKDAETLYFITDTYRIYKGDVLVAANNVIVTTEQGLPEAENAVSGVIYVVKSDDSYTIKVVNESGDAYVDASNTKVSMSSFVDGLISKVVPSSGATDDSIPTTKAVADAIANGLKDYNSALVDVSAAARAEDNSGTVLTFTSKEGTTKDVTISDLFLTSASYDSETHILSFTVKGVADPVTVDMSTLVGNSLSDVLVGDDESFTVELGSGGTLGGFKTGDSISKDTSLETIIKKLLMKQVPPTYTAPSVSIANNSGTASGSYEIGTTITPKLKATFTQNDAGALTSIQFKKAGTAIGDAQISSPATYLETSFILASTTTYTATASYSEGDIKNDNLGQPYSEGHIVAGSKTTSNYTFTPYRQGYFYGVLATSSSEQELTSDIIRSGSKKNGSYAAGNLPLISASSVVSRKRIFVACPATNKGVTKVVMQSAMNADCTADFVKQSSTITVEGADGYEGISYNVWVYEPASISDDQTFTVTLG